MPTSISKPEILNRKLLSFTLIELLVVVAIIAVLVALLLPALNAAREQARGLQCLSNLRGFGGALRMYANEYNDFMTLDGPAFPWSWYVPGNWPRQLGPYLDSDTSYYHDPTIDSSSGDSRLAGKIHALFMRYYCVSAPWPFNFSIAFHGAYGWNGVLDGDTWNFVDHRYVPPLKLDQINPEAAFLGDGNVVPDWGGVVCAILFQDRWASENWHYPMYRHNGAANFVYVDGHGGALPRTSSSKLRLAP
jgi:prepilin-type processing-associated H-X9-DG protein/prepilin-type N-terminal cleavage/methylation domain-containing protein